VSVYSVCSVVKMLEGCESKAPTTEYTDHTEAGEPSNMHLNGSFFCYQVGHLVWSRVFIQGVLAI